MVSMTMTLMFCSWPVRKKQPRWLRGPCRSTTWRMPAYRTSVSSRCWLKAKVSVKTLSKLTTTVTLLQPLLIMDSFFFSFQSLSFQTKPTSSMPCLLQPTMTLFYVVVQKASANNWHAQHQCQQAALPNNIGMRTNWICLEICTILNSLWFQFLYTKCT